MCVCIHTREHEHEHTYTRTTQASCGTWARSSKSTGFWLLSLRFLRRAASIFAPVAPASVGLCVCVFVCVCVCVCVRARARACVRACVTPRYTFMLHHVICLQTHAYRHTRTQCMFPWRELTHDDWLLPQLRGIQGAPHAVPLLSCIGAMVCRHRAGLVNGPLCLHQLAGPPTSACACVHASMRVHMSCVCACPRYLHTYAHSYMDTCI